MKLVKREISWPLNESGQNSPIRYKILVQKTELGVILEEASPWFKCTDYFNDVIYRQLGDSFSVYGFDNKDLLIIGDLFILIKDIAKGRFLSGLGVVNEWLNKLGHPSVTVESVDDVPEGQLVLCIPRHYLGNTAYMSCVIALIRACSYPTELTKLSQIATIENKFNVVTLKTLETTTMDLKYKKFMDGVVAFSGDSYTTPPNAPYKKIHCPHSKHKAGMMSWATFTNRLEELV